MGLLGTFCVNLALNGCGQVPQALSDVLSGMKTSFHPFLVCGALFGPCIHVCDHCELVDSPLMSRGCGCPGVSAVVD